MAEPKKQSVVIKPKKPLPKITPEVRKALTYTPKPTIDIKLPKNPLDNFPVKVSRKKGGIKVKYIHKLGAFTMYDVQHAAAVAQNAIAPKIKASKVFQAAIKSKPAKAVTVFPEPVAWLRSKEPSFLEIRSTAFDW